MARSTPIVCMAGLAELQFREIGVRKSAGLVARRAEAVHLHVHVAAVAQRTTSSATCTPAPP
jgi:hypothetical protein